MKTFYRIVLGIGTAVLTTGTAQAQNAAPIGFDSTVEGTLTTDGRACAPNDGTGRYYSFRLDRPSGVEVMMKAATDGFDTVVDLGQIKDCRFTILATNDDGGMEEGATNSRLVTWLTEPGTYAIRARGLNPDDTGGYQLTLRRLPPVPAPRPLTRGAWTNGTFGESDPTIITLDGDSPTQTNRPFHLYTLDGRMGDTVELRVVSTDEEADPNLDVGAMTPFGFATIMSNDDGTEEGDGYNSRLKLTFPANGTVTLRVSSLNEKGFSYRIIAQ